MVNRDLGGEGFLERGLVESLTVIVGERRDIACPAVAAACRDIMAMAERDASDFLDPVSRASEVIYCGKFRLLLESAEFVRSITVVVAQTLVDTELGIDSRVIAPSLGRRVVMSMTPLVPRVP